ncbi:MAG: electron transfer flavoprotein subunit alpha/FixB family protein [Planctomycetaceae bacterium]|jgi:electron transfer flavoprotein alpha subunit|nr:electron transfer flavoprotein subunit alpha/FixB family protein [Planctomycetaceae bacterium]
MIEKNESGEVWIYAETQDGELQEITQELCGKARDLADKLGVSTGAVLLGKGVESVASGLFERGIDKVYLVEDELLKFFRSSPYTHALVDLIKKYRPQIVLYGASNLGRDLAPRVASATQSGLTADCTNLDISDVTEKSGTIHKNLLLQIRPAFGGNIVATIVNYDHWPQMATVREGVFPLVEPDKNRQGKIIREQFIKESESNGMGNYLGLNAVEVIRREVAKRKINLKGARVIVAGGAGVGSKENFGLLFELANLFGGTVGASRAAVDSGFIGAEHQVGQTGSTVRPAIYIACGISGMVQHRVGMDGSAKIIAINNDSSAPIFSIAHYGIVGDLKQVIPLMIKSFRERT